MNDSQHTNMGSRGGAAEARSRGYLGGSGEEELIVLFGQCERYMVITGNLAFAAKHALVHDRRTL